MELLIKQNKAVQSAMESAGDSGKRAILEKLDMQSKSVMQEEEISRLEFDIQVQAGELKSKDESLQRLAATHEQTLSTLRKQLLEETATLNSYKDKITVTEGRCSALQAQMALGADALAGAHREAWDKGKRMEDRIAELEGNVSKLQREYGAVVNQRDGLQTKMEESERETRQHKREIEEVEKRFTTKEAEGARKFERVAQQLTDVSKTNAQLQIQCEKTKSLLLTIQQQRANLSEANEELKKELEEVYKRG